MALTTVGTFHMTAAALSLAAGAVAGSLPVGFIGGWLVMRNAPPMKRAVEAQGV